MNTARQPIETTRIAAQRNAAQVVVTIRDSRGLTSSNRKRLQVLSFSPAESRKKIGTENFSDFGGRS